MLDIYISTVLGFCISPPGDLVDVLLVKWECDIGLSV